MLSINRRGFTGELLKSFFDRSFALIALLVSLPLLIVATIGIFLTSPGPIFYKAHRVGKGGRCFSMFKFRTMHLNSHLYSAITSPSDNRIFAFGGWLRRFKIDEIPQFWNILIGDMSVVGPRPEDPFIVERDYNSWMQETLLVLPGLTGPGSLYGYIYGDYLLEKADPEGSYFRNLLTPKLALERAYLQRASFTSDLVYIFLTLYFILASIFRFEVFLPQVDIAAATFWAPKGPYSKPNT